LQSIKNKIKNGRTSLNNNSYINSNSGSQKMVNYSIVKELKKKEISARDGKVAWWLSTCLSCWRP
jgi:hypothetical protein